MKEKSEQKKIKSINDRLYQLEKIKSETRVKDLGKILKEHDPDLTKEKEMSDFLFGMINKCEMQLAVDKDGVTTYYKNNEWIIQQDYIFNCLRVRDSLIWQVFKTRFGLNSKEIKDFIDAWVQNNTQWRRLRIVYHDFLFLGNKYI